MKIINIDTKQPVNSFLSSLKRSNFLQSWEWFEFLKSKGQDINRLGVEENGEILAVCSLVKHRLPIGKSYYYCPRGPVYRNWTKELGDKIFSHINEIAKNDDAIFLRFESELIMEEMFLPITPTIPVQPELSTFLDLGNSLEELLSAAHQKTRYNIRLSQRKGVKVEIVESGGAEAIFDDFWRIMEETKERDLFRLHPKSHYSSMLKFGMSGLDDHNSFSLRLLLARYEKRIIAGVIAAFFGDTAVYVHGASSNQYRNVMAPYCLQWKAIELAKENGYKFYDFNGIDESKWPGVTRFKRNFGGEDYKYPGTFDMIFDTKWYGVYKLMRKMRRAVSR